MDNLISTSKKQYQFLSGGGEMGKLIREKDWSKISIGSPENWPQSLRTTISIVLNSKFPMFLFWGPELICFYNDAYRPSLGINGKHPFILGMRAEDAWPEIWHIIKPMIDQVLDGGEATWSEDQLIPIFRNGKMEDVYWTFSYSPVHDESGKPAGVLVTCNETTEKIITYKKLQESKEQLEFAIEATDLGTFDYNPLTNKFSANNQLKNWFGLPAGAEIELDYALNAIAEKDRETVMAAIQNTLDYSSGGKYALQYTIVHPLSKKETIVEAKGRVWFDENKIAYRFNGTLQDVTSAIKALQKLKESEQRFYAAINATEGIVWTNNAEGQMVGEQPGWSALTGQSLSEYEGFGWANAVHPDDAQSTINAWNDAVQHRKTFVFEHRVKSKNETWRRFSIRAIPLFNSDGSIREWVGVHTDITEQKKAEAAIRESEKRFRMMAENTDLLIAMGDETSNATYFNKAWVDFTGRPMEELLKFGWVDLIHPEEREKFVNIYLSAFKQQKPITAEFRVQNEQRDYRWLLTKGSPRFLTDGTFAGYISSCVDITEHKQAEETLKESLDNQLLAQKKLEDNEQRLNLIITASELGVWEINVKTKQIVCSDRFLEITGYEKPVNLLHDKVVELIHPDDIKMRDEAFKKAFETGILHFTGRIIWSDKSIHWVESRGKVFFDAQKNPEIIIGTIADITEEKRQQQILLENEQRFRLLADSMPQFIWTGSAEGNLNYFNQSVYKYSGLTTEQIEKNGWLQIVHPDEREENVKTWINSITTGQDFLFEHRFRRHDGEYRWQLSRAIPQRDDYGNIQMWVGTSTDIQEIKELDQQKDFFISMASHELKTPLTSIKGYVQMLQSMNQQSEDTFLKHSLMVIDKQVITLTNLVSDLLDVSKIKSGNLPLDKKEFSIDSLVKEIVEEIKHINPAYQFIYFSKNEVKVIADKERIGQVLINFLNNAVKYSPDSSHIQVESKVENNKIIISVSDSGIGIKKNDQEKIFDRFYRVEGKNEKTFPGFGIGLFICSEIVHRHQGTIGVNSEPGKGSIFYFSLPLPDKS